jgi:cytochrome c oxidase assembly protein subunit 15
MTAYFLLAVAFLHAQRSRRQAPGSLHAAGATALALLVTAQALLGILTLVLVVPFSAALLHQLGAVLVLAAAVIHLRAMRPSLDLQPHRA